MTVPLLVLCLACLAAGLALGWLLADRRATVAGATLTAERSLLDGRLASLSAQALAPLESTLAAVDAQLRQVEGERTAAYAGLRAQVADAARTSEALRGETAALVTALRAPQTRGRWGETQLRRVLEVAGALEHCDFVAQPSVRMAGDAAGPGALLRPDVVVRLAGGGTVVIDSKVPLAAHLEALEARDEASRRERRAAHARQVRAHVGQLAGKAYWQQFPSSPEFVVLFVPSDAVLDAALQADPSLQEDAFAADIVLATPLDSRRADPHRRAHLAGGGLDPQRAGGQLARARAARAARGPGRSRGGARPLPRRRGRGLQPGRRLAGEPRARDRPALRRPGGDP